MLQEFEPDTKLIDVKDKLQKIENQVLFISNTLSDIRNLFNNTKIKNEVFDINEVFEFLDKNFKDTADQKDIEIIFNAEKNFKLDGDKNLLLHALSNIIQNSIEQFNYNQENKTITISSNKSKDMNFITILDNAGGIDEKNLQSIFTENFTTKNFGMGIGLSFSKNIIESQFKGQITASNKKDGALFNINIPKNI